MEFTNRHNQRPTAGSPSSPSRPLPSQTPSRRPNNQPPTISDAVRSSGVMIKSALSHALKATVKEAKHLFKLTEEEFNLDNNPRWQKLRSLVRSVLGRVKLPRKVFVGIGVLIIILIGVGGYQLFTKSPPAQKTPKSFTTTKLEKGTPTYATLLPEGKSIESLGGWTRVSPPNTSPVYAFSDRVEGIRIIVSEQPLPDALKQPGGLEEFTKAYSADQKVTVEGTDVYIGTSAKGPQSAILTKNNLLILIKTDSKLTDAQWAEYVGSLQ